MGVEAKPVDQMFVVLTGPDCGGKSTLAAMLSHHYRIPITKGLRISDRAELQNHVYSTLYSRIKPIGPQLRPILMDRWQLPCDIVYERVHGRPESPLVEKLPELWDLAEQAKLLIFHVTASPESLLHRLNMRGDEEVDGQQILHARQQYIDLFANVNAPICRIDTTGKDKTSTLVSALRVIGSYYNIGGDVE